MDRPTDRNPRCKWSVVRSQKCGTCVCMDVLTEKLGEYLTMNDNVPPMNLRTSPQIYMRLKVNYIKLSNSSSLALPI